MSQPVQKLTIKIKRILMSGAWYHNKSI